MGTVIALAGTALYTYLSDREKQKAKAAAAAKAQGA